MIKSLLLFIIALFCFAGTKAQRGVLLHQDPRMNLLNRQADSLRQETLPVNGYRILIKRTNDRDDAYTLKAKLLRLYPDQYITLSYSSPFFSIKLGLFTQQADAEKQVSVIQTALPVSPVIVRQGFSAQEAALLKTTSNSNLR